MNKTIKIAIGAYYFKGSSCSHVILKESDEFAKVDIYTEYNEKVASVGLMSLSEVIKNLLIGVFS